MRRLEDKTAESLLALHPGSSSTNHLAHENREYPNLSKCQHQLELLSSNSSRLSAARVQRLAFEIRKSLAHSVCFNKILHDREPKPQVSAHNEV